MQWTTKHVPVPMKFSCYALPQGTTNDLCFRNKQLALATKDVSNSHVAHRLADSHTPMNAVPKKHSM